MIFVYLLLIFAVPLIAALLVVLLTCFIGGLSIIGIAEVSKRIPTSSKGNKPVHSFIGIFSRWR